MAHKERHFFCSVAVVWENTGSSAPFIAQNLRLHLAKKPCQNQRGHLQEFMTVSERTSGPDRCYRLIWPTEKVEAHRSSPEGLLLKLAKLVALSLARRAAASEEKNLKFEVWEFKGEENWLKENAKKICPLISAMYLGRGEKWVTVAGLLLQGPRIILQSVEIPTWPTETHNPSSVKIWSGKTRN